MAEPLHVAAGIVFGVIAVELAPRAFGGARPWAAALGFVLGGVFYLALEWLVDRLQSASHPGSPAGAPRAAGGAWMVYAAIAVDLFSDGLLIGAGSAPSLGLALVAAYFEGWVDRRRWRTSRRRSATSAAAGPASR